MFRSYPQFEGRERVCMERQWATTGRVLTVVSVCLYVQGTQFIDEQIGVNTQS